MVMNYKDIADSFHQEFKDEKENKKFTISILGLWPPDEETPHDRYCLEDMWHILDVTVTKLGSDYPDELLLKIKRRKPAIRVGDHYVEAEEE